jgi:hypothetical protein
MFDFLIAVAFVVMVLGPALLAALQRLEPSDIDR